MQHDLVKATTTHSVLANLYHYMPPVSAWSSKTAGNGWPCETDAAESDVRSLVSGLFTYCNDQKPIARDLIFEDYHQYSADKPAKVLCSCSRKSRGKAFLLLHAVLIPAAYPEVTVPKVVSLPSAMRGSENSYHFFGSSTTRQGSFWRSSK